MVRSARFFALAGAGVMTVGSALSVPLYNIIDLGTLGEDAKSSARYISRDGQTIVGNSSNSNSSRSRAFIWTSANGMTEFPNPSGNMSNIAHGVNNNGIAVGGTGVTSGTLAPITWNSGYSLLPLPSGETEGYAFRINNSNVMVGSVGSGASSTAVAWMNGEVMRLDQPTANGAVMWAAWDINNSNIVLGRAFDPTTSKDVAVLHNLGTNQTTSIGNDLHTYGSAISDAGHVAGFVNTVNSIPFIWTQSGGMQFIPIVQGASRASSTGVNSDGFVVGTAAASGTTIPFLYDGAQSYRLIDLLANNPGWNMTLAGAEATAISDNGIIVGQAYLNGQQRGFAMIPVPEPGSIALLGVGFLATLRRFKRAGRARS